MGLQEDDASSVCSADREREAIASPPTSFIAEDNASVYSNMTLSPAPSVYSLTSSLREQSIRWEYGRCVLKSYL